MKIGVGIATGLSVVGNMGSDMRFDYSVMGDSVNLASRLETLTAFYGLPILIASETARRCFGKLALIEVDHVRVKGKQEAVTIYAVVGGAEVATQEQFLLIRDMFHSMLSCYRARAWEEALTHLGHCRAINRITQLAKLFEIYSRRIDEFLSSSPPTDWEGVFEAGR
jgi:adenylate cyclase